MFNFEVGNYYFYKEEDEHECVLKYKGLDDTSYRFEVVEHYTNGEYKWPDWCPCFNNKNLDNVTQKHPKLAKYINKANLNKEAKELFE